MLRTMMKSKIHRATVTQADLRYTIAGERGSGGPGSTERRPAS